MGNMTSSPFEKSLLKSIPKKLIALPGKDDYHLEDVKPYNKEINSVPVAVAYPTTAEEVQAIIKCANIFNVKVQARCGGHSYGNYGSGGGLPNTITIDLKNIRHLKYLDSTKEIALIGGGALLGPLTEQMIKNGNRAFAHGVCPQVGLGGHATIGGLGPPGRMWGSALDHVVGATVVLANGSIVTVSDTENADLFWALKGAGASFGIITEFKIRTHPAPDNMVQYSYTFSGKPFAKHSDRLKKWQALVAEPTLDRRLASQIIITEVGMIIEGTFFGTEAEFEALDIKSVFPEFSDSKVVVFNNWLGILSHWADSTTLQIVGGLPSYMNAQSVPVTPKTLIPDSAIDNFFVYLDTAEKGTPFWLIEISVAGGATNDVPMDATAYAHRDALYYIEAYAVNPIAKLSDKAKKFLPGLFDTLTNAVPELKTNGIYPGYVEPGLGDGPGQLAYWRSNYARLQQVKAKWDPNDVFHNPQSVRLPPKVT